MQLAGLYVSGLHVQRESALAVHAQQLPTMPDENTRKVLTDAHFEHEQMGVMWWWVVADS